VGMRPARTRTAPGGRAWRVGMAPGRLPLVGHLPALARRPVEFVASQREHGDLVELRLGPRRAYMVCHPDLVREVLLDSRTYDKGGSFYDAVRRILGNGLIISDWADHRVQRRLVQPAFHQRRLASYATVMCEEAAALAAAWRPGGVVDINEATHTVAARVTFRSLFSTDAADDVVREVQDALIPLGAGVFRRTLDPSGLYQRLPLASNRRFERLLARLRTIIDELVDDRRRSARDDHGDVLSMLLAARDEDTGQGLIDDEVRDQVMNLLLGGAETAATMLAWTFHLVAGHPEVERRLHEEIDGVLAGRPVGIDDLPRLPYTRRVLDEALRVYSPIWMLSRVTTADTVLAGRSIPAGTTVLFSLYALHRDPEVFAEPDRFDPDRWLPDRAQTAPRHMSVAFGGGGRKCIGDEFAMVETMIVLATIAARWRLRAVPGSTTRPRPLATLSPGKLRMMAEPRPPAATGRVA
jgi:cytochrome P450